MAFCGLQLRSGGYLRLRGGGKLLLHIICPDIVTDTGGGRPRHHQLTMEEVQRRRAARVAAEQREQLHEMEAHQAFRRIAEGLSPYPEPPSREEDEGWVLLLLLS